MALNVKAVLEVVKYSPILWVGWTLLKSCLAIHKLTKVTSEEKVSRVVTSYLGMPQSTLVMKYSIGSSTFSDSFLVETHT